MLSKRVLYYGTEDPLPEQTELRAGPLALVYEEGDLRYIRLGDREVLRRVYVAVRDRNWGTVLPRLSNVRKEIEKDSFRITYDAENKQGEIDFFWHGTISGDADGTITFSMEGKARSTFLRNRIGFCVLHPIRECAGRPSIVGHVDGKTERSTFPRYISPHQPFLDMQAISHEVVPRLWAEVRFVGDTFETEDQRNWTDTSYKTYCTPLRLPFPVEVKAGTAVSQTIKLSLKGSIPEDRADSGETQITLAPDGRAALPLPRLGLGVASHRQPLSAKELERLKALNLSHLRLDLDLSKPDYASLLHEASSQVNALGVLLEVALFLSDTAEKELREFRATLDRLRPQVCTWLVFHLRKKSTTETWVRLARQYLVGYDANAKFGAGTNAYFAELNRGRPPVHLLDLVTFSANPQVHVFDNASLVENLEAQAYSVESAKQFTGGLPVAVSPITFRPRFNPDARGLEPQPAPGELPKQVDVRQMSLFGAGWTLGSLKYISESGAYSATYYETTGWRGVMETDAGSLLPEKFRSLPGSVFPLYHVLADAGEFAGGEVIPSASSAPFKVDGLILRKNGRTRILLANLGPESQTVRIAGISLRKTVRVKHLDETDAEAAMTNPEVFRAEPGKLAEVTRDFIEVNLRPFGILRIDTT